MSNKFLQDYISEKLTQDQEIKKVDDEIELEFEKDKIIVDYFPVAGTSIDSFLKSTYEIEKMFRQLKEIGKLP